MTVKSSVSLTDSQAAFARSLVEEGRYPSVSAVLQQGLEMLRDDRAAKEAEIEGLRNLMRTRADTAFIDADELDVRVARRIEAHRSSLD